MSDLTDPRKPRLRLHSIMVLVPFPLPGALAGLTRRHEDQRADKEREREKQEDGWWHTAIPFRGIPAIPLPGGEGVHAKTCEPEGTLRKGGALGAASERNMLHRKK
jgi:hypothetical protein